MNRRQFHCLATAGLIAPWMIRAPQGAPLFAAGYERELDWTCRIARFEPEPEHDSPPVITSVAVRSIGDRIAVVGDDHLVRLCDKATGEVIHKLHGHTDWVRCAAFHPTQNRLATSGNDRRILIWNTDDGEMLAEVDKQSDAVVAIALNAEGDRLATAGFQDRLTVYSTDTRRIVHELECPCEDMRCVNFSASGEKLAAGGRSGTIRIWDSATGRIVADLPAHRRRVQDVLFTDDGESVISCGEDRLIKITPLDDRGATVTMPRRPCKINTIAKIGDDLLASGGSDNLIRLWDLTNQTEIGHLIGHRGTVTSLGFDGLGLYSGSYDTELRIWTVSPEVAERVRGVPRIGRGGIRRPINQQ